MAAFRFTWLGVPALCILLLSGCSSAPFKYYLLAPVKTAAPAHSGLAVGVGPVTLPDYLDRPQIVTRTQGSEIVLADGHRWAEPLQVNVTNVLAENLAAMTGSPQIVFYPWKTTQRPTRQVVVDVSRFDADADRVVTLQARWSVGEPDKPAVLRRSTIQVAATGAGYEGLVAAQNEALARLSQEIAAELGGVAAAK